MAHLNDDIILGQGIPVHADHLHPGSHTPVEDKGVVCLEDGVEGVHNGGSLLGRVASYLDPEVRVCLVQHLVSVGKVLGQSRTLKTVT